MNESRQPDRVEIIRDWWARNIAARDRPAARALAARLRRADIVETLCHAEVHDLSRKLGLRDPARLAALVRVLAHVRDHKPRALAARMGDSDGSALRFERMVRATGDELPDQVLRVLPMIENTCDVGWLGRDMLDWSDKTRARWCFQYFDDRNESRPTEDVT
ncbi:type I-E CRISPR-associated protein Cse2/CasB [Pontivivens nitratireducens]|uniref:type I-E CRISPR-associated protein Cse2/CasB n=1 Tax=Pontivivens nitratireducens TaxID=2758038 RepID=UPI001639ACB0|nr:type I-E CRISPR-associated protein Cse2/CasB [Pontibrevibacter nitratireducens]